MRDALLMLRIFEERSRSRHKLINSLHLLIMRKRFEWACTGNGGYGKKLVGEERENTAKVCWTRGEDRRFREAGTGTEYKRHYDIIIIINIILMVGIFYKIWHLDNLNIDSISEEVRWFWIPYSEINLFINSNTYQSW